MKIILLFIFFYISIAPAINTYIKMKIDDATRFEYNKPHNTQLGRHIYEDYETGYDLFMSIFAVFVFPFKNKIREWRKINYLKSRLKQLKIIYEDDVYTKEIININRKLSLIKIYKIKVVG
ncbi:MAG: hypothetical protein JXA99_01965 [Candidatus Lokiarchaeota archaeon]|nr:hypothetical protein [Candidatus Lokiarchaeota archaeon]